MHAYLDKLASLTPNVRRIICDKGTEAPHSGAYNQLSTMGTYLCRRCGLALFRAHSQFSSGCGWPSFDESLSGPNVKRSPDADGYRTEILCARCDAHLGHVFLDEHFTDKNCRYCVNSLALDFVQDNKVLDTEEALLAGGCFWGVDYYLRRLPGVLHVEVGYSGGMMANPTYEQVCTGRTGHYEVARVIFDTAKIDYATILKTFFEIHDPCQASGQGPDIGQQYQSAIFYYNDDQYAQAKRLIQALKSNGYEPTTKLLEAQPFWAAEAYHQDYYTKHSKQPYCHRPVKRFKS